MSRRALAVVALAVLLACAGCVRVPDSGSIHASGTVDTGALPVGVPAIDPEPPVPGARPADVVRGFLDAMQASPVSTTVARLYLTREAQARWRPERRTITYVDRGEPVAGSQRRAGDTRVRVRLGAPEGYDDTGTWTGRLRGADAVLDLDVVLEDGEYRIADPPDALVVVRSWFDPRFTRADLYFFDPTARVLVPEPVVVPVGETRPSTLMRGLLRGPAPGLRGVEQSFVPPGLELALSVPVDPRGLATVALKGDLPPMTDQQTTLMFAQIAQTLRQDPRVASIQITVDGAVLRPPGGTDRVDVGSGAAFDGSRVDAGGVLYGLRRGTLVAGPPSSLDPLDGPLSTVTGPVRSLAVDVAGTTVAAVTDEGRALLTAPTRAGTGAEVRTLLGDDVDLLRPAWTSAGRLWAVDRDGGAARVLTQVAGPGEDLRDLTVPGITGADVARFLVSRDGSRLVALLRSPGGDRVVVSRVLGRADGSVRRALPAHTVLRASATSRLRDVAWFGDTALAVLTARGDGFAEVSTVGVDGSPTGGDGLTTTVADAVGLLGSPDPRQPFYAVTRLGLVDLSPSGGGSRLALDGVRGLGYGG